MYLLYTREEAQDSWEDKSRLQQRVWPTVCILDGDGVGSGEQ